MSSVTAEGAGVPAVSKRVGPRVYGAADLMVRGGQCDTNQAAALLTAWGAVLEQMPYRLREHVDRLEFAGADTGPESWFDRGAVLFERARLFGPGGDLVLRRDQEMLRWHYIGPGNAPAPTAEPWRGVDFWEGRSALRFARTTESLLLMGTYEPALGRWFDDRVAGATLQYPVPVEWSRVQVRYYRFLSTDGSEELTWLHGVEPARR